MTDLKPCPFCSAPKSNPARPPAVFDDDLVAAGRTYVYCWNCSAQGPSRPTEDAAVAAWNHRAPETERVWHPISTAPKDGASILVFCPSSQRNKAFILTAKFNYGWALAEAGGWAEDDDLPNPPTHWQPLPSPPTKAEGEQG